MKNNDKIKAFVQIGLMRKPRWVIGKFIEQIGESSVVEIHGAYHTVDKVNVKAYDPLESQDVVEEFANMNWDELKEVVIRAKETFFPNIPDIKINDDEHTISYQDVELSPSYYEVKTICGFKELPCWSVGYWKTLPATRHEPEDVDFVSEGQSSNNFSAAKCFIDAIWRYQTDGFWENIFYDNLAEDLED